MSAVFVISALLGGKLFPVLVGNLVETWPMMLHYLSLSLSGACLLIFSFANIIYRLGGRLELLYNDEVYYDFTFQCCCCSKQESTPDKSDICSGKLKSVLLVLLLIYPKSFRIKITSIYHVIYFVYHICKIRATPARTHLEGFSFVLKLKAQT